MRLLITGIALMGSLIISNSIAFAEEAAVKKEKSWLLGLKAGALLGGEMSVDTGSSFDVETDPGFASNITFDAGVAPKLTIGAFLFVARSQTGEGGEFSLATIGGTIKGRFTFGDGLQLRPGMHVGYQTISPDEEDSAIGFDIGAVVELAIPSSGNREWLVEVGFISQPVGGNDDYDLAFGPIFFIAGGIGFGG